MKIPKKVRVGAHDYKVVYPHRFKESPEDLYGLCNHNEGKIYVGEGNLAGSSFWHELLHVIDRIYNGNRLTPQEDVIDCISEGIFQVLEDNFEVRCKK